MSPITFVSRLGGASLKVLAIVIAVAIFAGAVLFMDRGGETKSITADFSQTTSLYVGSEVRVLGVPVGRVTDLEPKGEFVRATIEYDADVKIPEDAQALIVSPAIVGDRFIQLAPAYEAGPVLADEAHLSSEQTAVPVELDDVYASLDDLATALGPDGANSEGALSDLITSAAGQLDGQGAQLNQTITDFSRFAATLSGNSDQLFSSIRQVEEFVAMLEANDDVVRSFNDNTAAVAEVLAGERDDLAATLSLLTNALVEVESLVQDNRTSLRENVTDLKELTALVASREGELGQFIVNAPTALSNVALAYNPVYGTLDTQVNLPGTLGQLLATSDGPARLICSLVSQPVDEGTGLCQVATTLFDSLGMLGDLVPSSSSGDAVIPSDPAASLDPNGAMGPTDLTEQIPDLLEYLTGGVQ